MALPPLSADPDHIATLYAHCVDRHADSVPSNFARSVLAVLNAVVACDFAVPEALFAARLARPTEAGNTLYDVLAQVGFTAFARMVRDTRRTTCAHVVGVDDPYIWTFPVHIHLVRPNPHARFLRAADPDLAADLVCYDPAAARAYHTAGEQLAHSAERGFVEWRATRNLARVNHDFGPAGAAAAIELLRTRFGPYNDFYRICIARVGCVGIRFELAGVSEVFTTERVSQHQTGWLQMIQPVARTLNLIIPALGSTRRVNDEEFAFGPQWLAPTLQFDPALQRTILGMLCMPARSLGHVRGAARQFEKESGYALSHELGHLFMLQHLGAPILHPTHRGQDDFDYPCIGVASDTVWRPVTGSMASIKPDKALFASHLHSRSMYMNFMSIVPTIDDALFFTKGQAARARLFAQLHYGDWMTRSEPWPEAPTLVGRRNMNGPALLAARFDAAPGQFAV